MSKTIKIIMLCAMYVSVSCEQENESRTEALTLAATEVVAQKDIAAKFYQHEYKLVKELPPLQHQSRASGRTTYVPPGGMIVDSREFYIGGTNQGEVYATVPSGYVVTGVGGLINSGSNNYTSLVLEFRELFSDGTLGPRYRVYDGNNLEPYQLEAWYQVPENAIVWGVGVRGKYDIQLLSVYYRLLAPGTLRFSGPVYVGVSGLNPTGSNTVLFQPTDPNYGLDLDRSVLLGLGLVSTNGGTTLMRVDVGTMQ